MQILVIDNNIDPGYWGATELCAMARVAPGATIRVRRAPQGDLPRDFGRADRVIISGSWTPALAEAPWIDQLDEFIRRAIDAGKPLFGICYGHQSIARAMEGRERVRRAERGELGWGEIRLTDAGKRSALTRGLPETFHTYQSHNDEVTALPRGMRLLADSGACGIQAMELQGKPVYGVQFHPERGVEAAERSLARAEAEDPKREILNRKGGPKLYDAKVGETLFRNFLGLEGSRTP